MIDGCKRRRPARGHSDLHDLAAVADAGRQSANHVRDLGYFSD